MLEPCPFGQHYHPDVN